MFAYQFTLTYYHFQVHVHQRNGGNHVLVAVDDKEWENKIILSHHD